MLFAAVLPAALLALGAVANERKPIAPPNGNPLLVRRADTCYGKSCADCYGAGNVVCSFDSCFNPSNGEQCCADGTYCIGKTNACCGKSGAGVTGGNSVPVLTRSATRGLTTVAPTVTRAAISSRAATATRSAPSLAASSWDCETSDSREKCCQRGGDDVHWCSGTVGFIQCYRPTQGEQCCTNGDTCVGDGCCSDFGANVSTPNMDLATAVSTNSGASSVRNQATRSVGNGSSRTSSSTSTSTANSNNSGASGHSGMEAFAAVAAGVFGIALL